MKIISDAAGALLGPYTTIEVGDDGESYLCDGQCVVPYSILTPPFQVQDYDPLAKVSLSTAQQQICDEVDALAAKKRNAVTANISPAEMASWPIKRSEAIDFNASGDASTAPNLTIEATSRGITLAALVGKVIAKANTLSGLEAQVAGVSGKHQDAIRALTSVAEVMNYDFSGGWPI